MKTIFVGVYRPFSRGWGQDKGSWFAEFWFELFYCIVTVTFYFLKKEAISSNTLKVPIGAQVILWAKFIVASTATNVILKTTVFDMAS